MKRFAASLTLLVALAFSSSVLAQDSVRVGVITSLTGRFATFGEQQQAGMDVALEEVNEAGGINGVPMELVLEDDTSEVNVALAAAEQLVNQGLPLVMGAYSSSITNPLSQYFARQGYPFLVFTSSADSITQPGSEWVFRLNQPAAAYAEVLFDLMDQVNAGGDGTLSSIAIIHGNGTFESAVSDAALRLADERGYEIVEDENYDKGITDFRPVLNRFSSANPDVVMMVSYEDDGIAIMRQAKEVGLNAKLFAGGAAGFALPSFIEGAGDAADYVVTATAWTQDVSYPGAQSLYERLVEKLGKEPSYHAAQGYAAVITAADALRRATDMTPAAVRDALAATNLPDTAYGPIQFTSENGYMNQNPVKMIAEQVQDGTFATVFPEEAAVGDTQFPAPNWNER